MAKGIRSLCRKCPQCRGTHVRATLLTATGSYCQCEQCGHLWHEDQAEGGAATLVPKRGT